MAIPTDLKASKGLNAHYSDLKRMIKERGLLEKQPGFIIYKIIFNSILFAASLTILFLTDNIWIQLLNATFLAFIFGQMGFVAHDVGHRQSFKSRKKNDFFGLIHANLLIGMSYGWWLEKHNKHHANPNQQDLDPDIDIPVIAFSEEDLPKKRGIFRFIVKYQSIFFFPLLLFEAYSLRVGSVDYLSKRVNWKYRKPEIALLTGQIVWFLALVFIALGAWKGLVFVLVHQALFGLYLASVFAPNHKGMLIIPKDSKIDFLRLQVLTARNVRAHPITDFWYGGLNYQIEHHLFPTMARNKLREAQQTIRKFCDDLNISYHETSMPRSYVEILQYLHIISAPLRAKKISDGMAAG